MTSLAGADKATFNPPQALFAVTVFSSATLVFLVQPMVAKLVLPLLGGSPSVWNTSMAFFQIALLVGYGYAHLLQRIASVRRQAWVHGAALILAAIALPLRVNELAGPPSSEHPNIWLLTVLTLSIGAPFAVLSATAPLVQAWYARTVGAGEGKEPYVLYSASNLGSLIALLAYPILLEPTLTVHGQRMGWSVGYGAFVLLMAGLAFMVLRARDLAPEAAATRATNPVPWRDRLVWVGLAAIPSSLMLGVTTHITTDVASAPFLWVIPLALYLTTFIIAFQAKPAISPSLTLVLQGAALAACAAMLPFKSTFLPLQLLVHLGAFFLTALMCHQALVARRPDPTHLTEFYLWMSVGGVVGGAFNAFLAPIIFSNVWEYPIVLVLACLARPWGSWRIAPQGWVMMAVGALAAAAAPLAMTFLPLHFGGKLGVGDISQDDMLQMVVAILLTTSVIAAFLVRGQALLYFAVIAILSMGATAAADRVQTTETWRSFFGVLVKSETDAPALGGPVRMLAHGTTLHGAQAVDPHWRCQPLVYYTTSTPIGQVFLRQQDERPAGVRIGAVGLGTGSVAAYVRPGDYLTFFEIDPLVIRIASDPENFSYTTECVQGRVDYVVGDARLTVAQQPPGTFDILLIDAFSSDAVPTHLLTVEAVRGYLTRLKPDGVLILHLSNRHLDLKGPAQAVARAAGGHALLQQRRVLSGAGFWEADEDALIIGKSPEAIAAYAADPRWLPSDPTKARPWTDDYTNIPGAMWRRLKERFSWLP
jgi:SAM-dependent methyltransferase